MATAVETERKFDAELGQPLPDLSGLACHVGAPDVKALEATYFDTADGRLARHGITLRRRTGGDDAGWHLKIPVGPDERLEVQRPLGRSERIVPKALLAQVRALVRDRALLPVGRLRTSRTEHRLLDDDGAALAVVADDVVHGQRLTGEAVEASTWREVEVELLGGDRVILEAVSRRLREGGLRPSAHASKLARVLGDTASATATPRRRDRQRVGDVVLSHLREQVAELVRRDPQARSDEPDGVHKMRVATRRLRSAMATYRPVLEASQTDPLRQELQWLGQLLGRARDAEVQVDRLRALVAAQDAELVLGPVRRRVDLELRARHRAARASLVAELDSPRYWRLLDALEDMLAQPALTRRARKPAAAQLPRLVGRAVRRVDKAVALADRTVGAAHDEALHEVRKSAKRARYAAESAVPVAGKPAARLAERMERVQEVLGEHQDSVTSRALLRELAVAAHGANENGFTFGLLHRVELERGVAARQAAEGAIREASRPGVRRWLG
jgi:CHAD domain-containing protein